jgi:glycosyltransferase involved in cell wall biosynthesis
MPVLTRHSTDSGAEAAPARVVRITARLNVGGIARHVTWLTAGLDHDRYESILVTGTVPAGEEDMGQFARHQGVEPIVIPEMSRELSVKDLITVWKLYRLFVRYRPAVIHTHSAKAGAAGRLAGLLYRWLTPLTLVGRPRTCRLVHTFHGHIFHSYYGRWKTWLFLTIEKILARIATDRIVVISPTQLEEIHDTFGVGRADQFTVVPLGLDLTAYADAPSRRHLLRDELKAAHDDVLVGIVGRLTEIKNHELFLRVARLFQNQQAPGGRRVRFLVIGNGHLRGDLEAQTRALGLEETVYFLGNREDPEVFYPALDVVALTSRNEGTPLTLIEAMANGRATIATDVGGVVDLLGPAREPEPGGGPVLCERGVLVPPGDAEAFCRGLVRLVEDEGLRRTLGDCGRAFVECHYTKERLLRDVAKLYEDLLNPEAGRGSDVALTPTW